MRLPIGSNSIRNLFTLLILLNASLATKVLAATVDDRPLSRVWPHFRIGLPRKEQEFVIRFIDTVLEKAQKA